MTQNTAKQNYLGSVTLYNTRPGNDVRLFHNAPEPTQGKTVSGSAPLDGRMGEVRIGVDHLSQNLQWGLEMACLVVC